MTTPHRDITYLVHLALNRIFDIESTYEYPGYIAIPEKFVNDDTTDSGSVWHVGPATDGRLNCWAGQLMTPDGGNTVSREMNFEVFPKSTLADEIAGAIYAHGIGDLYIGGGCSEKDCPRKPNTGAAGAAPVLYQLDGLSEAFDVRWYCSVECRELEKPQLERVVDGYSTDFVEGTQCEACGRPLARAADVQLVTVDREALRVLVDYLRDTFSPADNQTVHSALVSCAGALTPAK